jgi:hypothetical protein
MRIHAVEADGTVHAADERQPSETLCGREHGVDLAADGLPEPKGEDLDRVECEECRVEVQRRLEDPEFGY